VAEIPRPRLDSAPPGAAGAGTAALGSVRHALALYPRLVQAQIRSQLEYRTSFALQVAGQFGATFLDFITIVLLFNRFPTLAGWSLGEVVLMYGLAAVGFALADLATNGFDTLSELIRTGQFDRMLTRPAGTFMQMLAADVQLRRLGRVAQGVVALGVAVAILDLAWTPAKAAVAVGAIVSGAVIFGSIFVIGAAVTFWTVTTSEVTNAFTYGGAELASWPLPIYADWLRRFFTFVVPLAFVSYLPALFILERPDPLGLPPALQAGSLAVAALFFLAARGAWAAGVRHYQGTGS
jgi:ABC-2 type transport system permease protein